MIIQMKMWKSLILIVIMACSATSSVNANIMNTCLNKKQWCSPVKPTCDVIKLNSDNRIQVLCYGSRDCFFKCTLTTVSPISLTSKDDSRHSLTMEHASFTVQDVSTNGITGGEEQTWFQSNVTFSQIHLNGSCMAEAIAAHPGTRHHDLDVSHCVHDVNLTWEMIPVDGLEVTRKVVTLTSVVSVTGLLLDTDLSSLLNCGVSALYMTGIPIGVVTNNTFPSLPTLELLDLSRCGLTSIEDSAFSQLTNLKFLNLAGNRLKKIPNAVLLLPKLETLHFSHNGHLSVDRRELCKLSTLRSLDLSFNTFDYQNSTFEGKETLTSLKILNISSTRYISGEFLEMFPNLEVLIWTHIGSAVGEIFDFTDRANILRLLMKFRLKQLKTLDLSSSEIVEDDLKWDALYNGYQHLRLLNLANNNIKKLQSINVGHPLNVSRVLNLSGNHIETWNEEIMNETQSLKFELDLTRNNIRVVSEAMIEDFSKFNAVYLSENAFGCGNCSLILLLDWLKKNTTRTDYHMSPYKCASPYEMRGHMLNADSLPTNCLPIDIGNDSRLYSAVMALCFLVPGVIVTVALVFLYRIHRLRARI